MDVHYYALSIRYNINAYTQMITFFYKSSTLHVADTDY